MDKQQAVKLVRDTFEAKFDRIKYIKFLKELLNHYDDDGARIDSGAYIPDKFKDYVQKFERIGKYTTGNDQIMLFIVYLKKETSIDQARTMQRNLIAWYLQKESQKDAALVAFVSPNGNDWRFSLIKMEYQLIEKNGKFRGVEEFTPARRWSFLVGINEKSHTAQSRLYPIMVNDSQDPTLDQLENAFNIEKVTDEFFEKYRGLFIQIKIALDKEILTNPKIKTDFQSKGINTVDFAKKLLGQIIFLYFLQKKGWFGVPRDGEWGTGSKQFLRELYQKKHGEYHDFFNDILEPLFYDALRIDHSHDDHYYSRFNCKIPFLNGGLFDPMNDYDWVHADILLPNELFSNNHKTNEGDIGDGILDIFDRYNFTVREDEPFEKEVAIDPELLGKAYEKFNAIRADNFSQYQAAVKKGGKAHEVKFNKQYGVFYTPREIVHYMCQESLIQYLSTQSEEINKNTTISPTEIQTLILYGEKIIEHDTRVKTAGHETKKYSYLMPESIRRNAKLLDSKLANIKICDPAIGSGAFAVGMMNEIIKARLVLGIYDRENFTSYDLKKVCIENSIYGVDIDPGAVEIAKLRLWLSLVIEEEDIHQIKPLPNLDFKIMCGDSLLSFPDIYFVDPNLTAELEDIKRKYIHITNPSEKSKYRDEINILFLKIVGSAAQFNPHYSRINFDFRTHFSEVFHSDGGFDIVIGNPPYVRVDQIKQEDREIYKESFKTANGKYDLYYLFFEKCRSLINFQGTLSLITPNKFCAATSAYTLRSMLLNDFHHHEIISTSLLGVFEEAANYPIISIFSKAIADDKVIVREAKSINALFESTDSSYILNRKEFLVFPNSIIPINVGDRQINLTKRLLKEFTKVGDFLSISEGLRIPEKYEKKSGEFKIVKQYQFEKWSEIKEVTRISKIDLLKVLSENSDRYKKIMQDKIIFAEDALRITATLDTQKYIPQGGVYFGVAAKDDVPILAILSIINSRPLSFLYRVLFGGMHMGGGYLRFRTTFLENLPIPDLSIHSSNNLITYAQDLLKANQFKEISDINLMETEIDNLVCDLYDLTEEERTLIKSLV